MKFKSAGHVRTHGVSQGTSVDVQASQHDLTAHTSRYFSPKRTDRWSWHHYCTDCIIWQLYKEALAWAPGVSSSWVFGRKGHWLCSSYFRVPHGVGLLNIQGSVSSFLILYVCAMGSLGHLKLLFLSSLCVSWVVHRPASLPGIGEAIPLLFGEELHFGDKMWHWCIHQNLSASP